MMTNMPASAPIPGSFSSARVDRLRIRHLKLLDLISATGTLTAAADALRISQPSATKMLQELETAFGCRLMERTTRGGVLSPAGERALERLRIALGALDAAGQAFAEQPEMPLVRIGMLPLAGVALIPRLVAELAASGQLPRLWFQEGSVSEVLDRLRAGEIDCVIGRIDTESARKNLDVFEIDPLADENLEIACAQNHPLARARKLALSRLLGQPWILPLRATYTRQMFEAAFVGIGLLPPRPHIESSSFHTNLATVAESRFLTIAPKSAVSYYATAGKVRKLSLAEPFPINHLVFITLKGAAKLPAVGLIQAAIRRHAG